MLCRENGEMNMRRRGRRWDIVRAESAVGQKAACISGNELGERRRGGAKGWGDKGEEEVLGLRTAVVGSSAGSARCLMLLRALIVGLGICN